MLEGHSTANTDWRDDVREEGFKRGRMPIRNGETNCVPERTIRHLECKRRTVLSSCPVFSLAARKTPPALRGLSFKLRWDGGAMTVNGGLQNPCPS